MQVILVCVESESIEAVTAALRSYYGPYGALLWRYPRTSGENKRECGRTWSVIRYLDNIVPFPFAEKRIN